MALSLFGRGVVAGGFDLGDDAGQTLRHRVVDLAGQSLALVEHPCLARLAHQLSVESGVLLESRLQVGHGQPPLLAEPPQPFRADYPPRDGDGLHDEDDCVEDQVLRLEVRVANDKGVDQ